jgi:hypothetical protein
VNLQVFTLCLTMFTFFGQFVVFLTPSIQMAQIMVSGGRSAHKLARCNVCKLLHAHAHPCSTAGS